MDRRELLIVGGGAAGMTAAIAAHRAGCESILLVDSADALGGVLPQCIHEGFGLSTFGRELTGPEYADTIIGELRETGIETALNTCVVSVSKDRHAVLSSPLSLRELSFRRMILAAGCREISIGALNIAGTRPAGIFTAGQAQELINLRHLDIGGEIVIIGSGDLGMIMARRLTLEGKHVAAVIERLPNYSGMARNYHRCIEQYSIPLLPGSCVTEVFGEERVQGVTVSNMQSGERAFIPCDTLVTAVGMIPEQALIKDLGAPDWLSLCGNCSRVHDIIDSAVEEAKKLGEAVGREVRHDR